MTPRYLAALGRSDALGKRLGEQKRARRPRVRFRRHVGARRLRRRPLGVFRKHGEPLRALERGGHSPIRGDGARPGSLSRGKGMRIARARRLAGPVQSGGMRVHRVRRQARRGRLGARSSLGAGFGVRFALRARGHKPRQGGGRARIPDRDHVKTPSRNHAHRFALPPRRDLFPRGRGRGHRARARGGGGCVRCIGVGAISVRRVRR